jgi:RNA polymerase-binding transcription factor DksA
MVGAMQNSAPSPDLNYLLYRQQVERLRAEDAVSDEARNAHRELARRYEREIEKVAGGEFTICQPGTPA